MRRLLFVLGLLLLPVLAGAQPRETLLTPDGTLFTIESRASETAVGEAYLKLRVQQGGAPEEEIVPASLEGGAHVDPAIAYDGESRTLFVFWLRQYGIMGSQLMFACRDANGTWSEARSFGGQFDLRENLRIAVTRKVSGENGKVDALAAISVHLVWWEYDANDGVESAQYAMVSIENGKVVDAEPLSLDLTQFIEAAEIDQDANLEVLKQPLLFSSPKLDSVLVVFGDYDTRRMQQVRVTPTKPIQSEGRLRVPVGRREGSVGGPRFLVGANARVEGLYGSSSRIALFTRGTDKLEYVITQDGDWTEPRTIALDSHITSDTAVDALRRLVNEH